MVNKGLLLLIVRSCRHKSDVDMPVVSFLLVWPLTWFCLRNRLCNCCFADDRTQLLQPVLRGCAHERAGVAA
jgi:hypothetical protein